MALVLADRVQETATAPGTGTVTLLGAALGFQSFAAIGNGNTTFYCIADQVGNNWEVGIGTYTSSGTTLARNTVLASSNSGSLVNFSSGTQNVFVTYPSEKSVNLDSSGNVSALGTIASGTWQGTTVGVAYGGTGVTASSGPNSVVLRDANGNIVGVNNVQLGLTATVGAGGSTALTAASTQIQILTGSSNQDFVLPDATTLLPGFAYTMANAGSGVMTIKNYAGTTIETIEQGGAAQVLCTSNGSSAGTWGFRVFAASNTTWGNAFLDYPGAITSATWNGVTVGTGYGGTGLTTFGAANYAIYSTSSSALTAGTLPVAAGGTGATTLTGYVKGNGTSAMTAASTIPGADVTGDISGNATNVTGTVLVDHGGTGLTSVAQYNIPFGDTSTALTSATNFQYNGSTLRVGAQPLLGGTTNPIIGMTGSSNGYIQGYIYNANTGTSASADLVAYPDNGADANGWVDMGITSSTYSDAVFSITGANESYLFASAPVGSGTTGNLVFGTDSTGIENAHQWYVNGFNQAKSAWAMQLNGSGLQLANPLDPAYGGTGSTSLAAGGIVTYTGTETLTNKRVTPRVGTTTSGSTITPTSDASDQYNVTALATTAAFAAPSGTPTDGQKLTIRIKDDGTPQTLSWDSTYREIGVTLPLTTTASKVIYIGCIWNSQDTFWDVVSVAEQA